MERMSGISVWSEQSAMSTTFHSSTLCTDCYIHLLVVPGNISKKYFAYCLVLEILQAQKKLLDDFPKY